MPEAEIRDVFGAQLPEYLKEALQESYSAEECLKISEGFSSVRMSSFRVNRLKTSPEEISQELDRMGIEHTSPSWFADAFVISPEDEKKLRDSSMYEQGEIYMQNLSSMIPPLLTDIPQGCDVLDMCAAPGGKTTEIVSISGGRANVTACEKDRIRADRLRFNLARQGCSAVNVLTADARKLDSFLRFDRIFLDAPCSGSGTVLASDPRSYRSFSKELVRNSSRLQSQLLAKGLSMLKKGGVLVYSTCSLLPEENDGTVLKALRPGHTATEEMPDMIKEIPSLTCRTEHALTVCPGPAHEGFFAAVIRKL